jgi:hypothetical protein
VFPDEAVGICQNDCLTLHKWIYIMGLPPEVRAHCVMEAIGGSAAATIHFPTYSEDNTHLTTTGNCPLGQKILERK